MRCNQKVETLPDRLEYGTVKHMQLEQEVNFVSVYCMMMHCQH